MVGDGTHINAMPTKAFFVDMLVKDIPLERAVLDLVDNCVDGAKRLRPEEVPNFTGLEVKLQLSGDRFEIEDNCGGFDVETAKNYAFRFGRPAAAKSTDYSIGQFGVGMKRALFKFGRYFEVHSTTKHQKWSMTVDVDEWEGSTDWFFNFDEIIDDQEFPEEECGTRIIVRRLRPEVASRFSAEYFRRQLSEMIRSHQRQFLAFGMVIDFEGMHLTNTDLRIRTGGSFSPAIEEYGFDGDSDSPIFVRIVAGISESVPAEAGWYVVCNGRVILSADRSEETGWGSVAEQKEGIPKYHNQYARFRGIVFFNCRSSSKLPWNTTKTGLDSSSVVWQATYPKMLDHTRTVIKFLNSLDDDIEEYGRSSSPLLAAMSRETLSQDVEKFQGARSFSWNRSPRALGPKMVKIQYSREESKIRTLMTALGVSSAKAVGENTFDMIYTEQANGEGEE
ncbi:ATP-binding protein [Novosphingobium humi]|uniref:ATP-binding protein n=1 Tax=Novosphingobium humi TaxID=2282397 RepID=A0ABY7TUM3_9SPHN|nr:ATP-binding protein [Novosphingobium humi]WCT76316.1 ATP-binding protein [Novosphingobium humi]